jgi:hypothetical protein
MHGDPDSEKSPFLQLKSPGAIIVASRHPPLAELVIPQGIFADRQACVAKKAFENHTKSQNSKLGRVRGGRKENPYLNASDERSKIMIEVITHRLSAVARAMVYIYRGGSNSAAETCTNSRDELSSTPSASCHHVPAIS